MSAVEERSAAAAPTAGSAYYPWLLIGLLWMAAFLNSAGRQILVTVLPQVRAEFGLSATQLALVNSVAFWVYAVCALIFGRLGDATHRSRLIVAGLAFWAVATGMVSLATGLITLIAMRSLVAAGEGTYYPTAAALISDWHRSGTRSRALSLHQTGVFAGAGVGAVAAGALADAFGWRSPFVIFGLIALIFCGVLFKLLRDAPVASHAASSGIAKSQGPLRLVLQRPAALMLCAVFFLANGAVCGIIVWAPTFLHDELGLDLAASALYGSATLSAAGIVCVPLGGFLAHRMATRTPLAVFHVLAIGLALAGLLLLPLALATSAFAVGAVLFASGAGKGLFDGCIYAAMHEVVPPTARATAVGLMTLVGFCGAGLAPIGVAGQRMDRHGAGYDFASGAVSGRRGAAGGDTRLDSADNPRNAADRGRRTMTGQTLSAGGVVFSDFAPLIDGRVPACEGPQTAKSGSGWTLTWSIGAQRFVVEINTDPITLKIALEGVAGGSVDSLGLRIGRAANVVRYLRNGYTSWDGSYFVELDAARGIIAADPTAVVGYAMTALVSEAGETAVLGFLRHDRFQSRFRFAFAEGPLSIDVETLIDGSVRSDRIEAEPLILLSGADVEETLREWARRVVQASPLPPRTHERRIAGWCSWYNLYASITEPIILEHLAAAAQFRDRHQAPFDVFQIDDGFTPEMGDWLDVKPQFPRGMKPLLADIRAKGFTPGMWIAPFMIGNRSRLYAEHPDWVVTDRTSGKPIAPMTFYGEFRWHKRSEEYYVLDITHPAAEAYVRKVFRTWARDWGCGYFKTDFMFFGSDYGPREARWHVEGLSRIEIWMRMARLIREEIGDALWLGCGGPIWAGIGLLDAVRIGRDVGVSWEGHYSAESLLRDQTSRNFGNGIFWQSDPDCILLRERFHHLTDEQVRSLALFAGLSGGVLMTSDRLDEISDERARLFADLARESRPQPCDFPQLGRVPLRHRIGTSHTGAPKLMSEGDPVLIQRVRRADGEAVVALLNTGSTPADREVDGVLLSLPPYATRMLPRQ